MKLNICIYEKGEDGVKTVNYNGLIPYLVEAVKELKKENELLKAEIQKLKK